MTAPESRPATATPPGDLYTEAAREIASEERVPSQEALDADRESDRTAGGDPDVVLATTGTERAADDAEAIDRSGRAGDEWLP